MKLLFRIAVVLVGCAILGLGISWKRWLSEQATWWHGQFGTPEEQKVVETRLSELLSKPRLDEDELFDNACRVAALWDGNTDQFVPAIQKGLVANKKNHTGQWLLLQVMAFVGSPKNGAQQALAESLDSIEDSHSSLNRSLFLQAVGNVGLDATLLVRLISDVETNPSRYHHRYKESLDDEFIRILDEADRNCGPAIPQLREFTKSASKSVRLCAYRALYHMGAISFKDVSGYRDYLVESAEDAWAKENVVWKSEDAWRSKTEPVSADEKIISSLKEAFRQAGVYQNEFAQSRILSTLATIGPGAAQALPEIITGLKTPELERQALSTFEEVFGRGTPSEYLNPKYDRGGTKSEWSYEYQELMTLFLRHIRGDPHPREWEIKRLARVPQPENSYGGDHQLFSLWSTGKVMAHAMLRSVTQDGNPVDLPARLPAYAKWEFDGELICIMASCDSGTARLAGDLLRRCSESSHPDLPFHVFADIGYPDPVFHWRMFRTYTAIYGMKFLLCEFLSLACVAYTVYVIVSFLRWLVRRIGKAKRA